VSTTITQPSELRDSITSIGCGTATVGVAGGTPAYTYSWAPHGGSTATASVTSVGTYTVTVKDKNGCSVSASASITCPGIKERGPTGTGDSKPCCDNNIVVYPNPNNGIFTVAFGHPELVSGSQTIIEIYNVLGQKVTIETLKPVRTVQPGGQVLGDNLINLSNQPSGIYLYRVIEENGNLLGEGKIVVQK
jgi:hypothetical protein